MQKLLTKKCNKGFTLIELIVVMAVIAILVLLAAPRFINYTKDAKITQIKNDIKVVEEVVEEYLVRNDDELPSDLDTMTETDVNSFGLQNRLFNRAGKVTNTLNSGEEYAVLDDIEIIDSIKTKLEGTFIVDKNLTVFYIHNMALSNSESHIEVATTFIKTIGGSSYDFSYSVIETSDGGYMVFGDSDSIDGDLTGLNKGNTDAIIAKLDADGNKVWLKTVGGSGRDYLVSAMETSDGGYIVVGNSNSTNGDLVGLNIGNTDAIIAKLDADGNKVWLKTVGGTAVDSFSFVLETSDGGYIAVGHSFSTNGDLTGLNKGNRDAIMVKFDASGNKTWLKTIGGSGPDYFGSVIETSDGDYVAIGSSSSTNGDLLGLNNGLDDAVIAKLDASGNKVWLKTIGGSSYDYFYSVLETSDGGYMVVGDSYSTDGDLTGLNKGERDAIIVKLDTSGNKVWLKTIGGSNRDSFFSIVETSDGGYIVAGDSNSTDGDLTGLNNGSYDGIIVKLDASGNKVWLKTIGGSNDEFFYSVKETSDGGYVTVGDSDSIDGDLTGLNKGNTDAIIVKLDASGNLFE